MSKVRLFDSDGNIEIVDAIELKAQGRNHFKGWLCSAGQRNLYIDWDGNVFVGTCRVGGKQGNVFDEEFSLPDSWIVCDKDACNCVTEIQLIKAKEIDYRREHDCIIPVDDHPIYVQWDVGRRCNFDCSYCPSFVHNAHEEFHDYDLLKDVTVRLHTHYNDLMMFCFAGGEPTLHPDFVEWCAFIQGLGHMVHVQTNGARLPQFWDDLVPVVNGISLSVHFEFMTDERLKRTVDAILAADGNLEVKLMAHPDHWDRVMKTKEMLADKPLTLLVLPLRTSLGRNTPLMDYTAEQMKEMGTVNTP